jgi:hypothetical protein
VGSLTLGKTAAAVSVVDDVVARARGVEEPRWLAFAAAGATLAGDESSAIELRRRAVTLARRSGAVDTLALVLATVTETAVMSGRVDLAPDAAEGLRLAREAGLPNVAILHLAALAWFAAINGDDEYKAYAAEVRAVAPAADDALAASIVEWELRWPTSPMAAPTSLQPASSICRSRGPAPAIRSSRS